MKRRLLRQGDLYFLVALYAVGTWITVAYTLDRLVYMCFNTIWLERAHGYDIAYFERQAEKRRKKKALEKFKKKHPDEYHRIQTLIKD